MRTQQNKTWSLEGKVRDPMTSENMILQQQDMHVCVCVRNARVQCKYLHLLYMKYVVN